MPTLQQQKTAEQQKICSLPILPSTAWRQINQYSSRRITNFKTWISQTNHDKIERVFFYLQFVLQTAVKLCISQNDSSNNCK